MFHTHKEKYLTLGFYCSPVPTGYILFFIISKNNDFACIAKSQSVPIAKNKKTFIRKQEFLCMHIEAYNTVI